jgi:hypothetical protein
MIMKRILIALIAVAFLTLKPRFLTYVSFKEMGRFLGSFDPKQPRFYALFLMNDEI